MTMAKKKILVIDDDPEICEALEEILAEYDYEVFSAQDTAGGSRLKFRNGPFERSPDPILLHLPAGVRCEPDGDHPERV